MDVEEIISDAAMLERTDDTVLKNLIELAVVSLDEERPVFPSPLDEPVLWRKFRTAVHYARSDAKKAKAEIEKALPDMTKV